MTSSTTTLDFSPGENPIDNTLTYMPEPSSSSTSPAATEIAFHIIHIERLPEERLKTLGAAGIKVRDFVYEPVPYLHDHLTSGAR